MQVQMDHIAENVRRLSDEMKARDWDGAFLANGAYPDTFEKSLTRYLEQSETGNEPGIRNGITMTTYAQWTDDSSDYVVCRFAVRQDGENALRVKGVEIASNDAYGHPLKTACLIVREPSQLPSRRQAIAEVIRPKLQVALHKNQKRKARRI